MKNDSNTQKASRAFFGRRHGKALRAHQRGLLETVLPRLLLDVESPYIKPINTLFGVPVSKIWLEIGFGGGEHLFQEVCDRPDVGFIGVEPFVNGMAKFLSLLDSAPSLSQRVRLYNDDAVALLDALPNACLDGADLLYPDPWPKKKHWKRRFINEENLERLARVMAPGAIFRFATDIESYVDWALLHFCNHKDFIWLAAKPEDWQQPFEGWQGTRYEAKALREGRVPTYLSFVRR